MVLKVYVDMLSQPCRSLMIFLKHTEIPFEVVTVKVGQGDQTKPEFTNLFPLGKVPAIQDGDFALAETEAIIRYLAAKYQDKVPDFLYPKDLEKRARLDEYFSWHHSGTRSGLCDVYINEVVIPILKWPPPSEEKVKKDLERMNSALDKIENVFLKDSKFLTGDEANIGDVMAVSEMIQNITFGRNVLEGRLKLAAFVERVKERFNPVFDEVNAPVVARGKEWQKQ